jgi:uroporphyrinogen-III synthase
MGLEPVIAPLLEVRTIEAEVDLHGIGALAFTSANAVRIFAERSLERALLVFAVGAATAMAAKAERFRTVLSTEGDVEALAAGIAARRRQFDGAVLHPGAAEPAGDLAAALAGFGVATKSLTLYESVPIDLPENLLERLPQLDGVLIHSPKAGRRLAEILEKTPAPGLAVYCLSTQVAATLAGAPAGPLTTATLPNEDALLSLIAP